MVAKIEKKNFYWLSFCRKDGSREGYVVIEEAPSEGEAVKQAVPLKDFNKCEWSLQGFQIHGDGEELKDFKLHTLITKADLIAKGYQKA